MSSDTFLVSFPIWREGPICAFAAQLFPGIQKPTPGILLTSTWKICRFPTRRPSVAFTAAQNLSPRNNSESITWLSTTTTTSHFSVLAATLILSGIPWWFTTNSLTLASACSVSKTTSPETTTATAWKPVLKLLFVLCFNFFVFLKIKFKNFHFSFFICLVYWLYLKKSLIDLSIKKVKLYLELKQSFFVF